MASHTGHSHDNTPSARATCRKMIAAGQGPAQADTTAPKVKSIKKTNTGRKATFDDGTSVEIVTVDPFEQAKANAIGQLAIWCAKALELAVDVAGPTPLGGNTMYVFKGDHGALVVSINPRGMIHVARVSEKGRKSPVLRADVVEALEQIA